MASKDDAAVAQSYNPTTGSQESDKNTVNMPDHAPSDKEPAVADPAESREPTPTTESVYSIKSTSEKIFIISLTGLAVVLCLIPTNIVLPILPTLKAQYDVTTTDMNLLVTAFSLVQGITPALMSSLSDFQGRRIAWMVALLVYTAANIGLALQDTYVALIILRCLQSAGSSCAVPFGFAVAADVASPAERGRYIGTLQGCVFGAFAFGPVIGGALASSFGWRSVFWFLAIGSGSALALYILIIPETARNVVGNGSIEPKSWWRRPVTENIRRRQQYASKGECKPLTVPASPKKKMSMAQLLQAFTILAEKDAFILILFASLLYYGITAMWASTGSHFGSMFNLTTLEVGFAFLPYGVTGGIGSILSGKLLDANYQRILRHQKQTGTTTDFPYEVARLQVAVPFALMSSLSFIAYGWVIETGQSLAVALVLQGLIGVGATPLLGVIYTLLIDLYPAQAVATQGAADLVRCWLGAISAAVIDYMLSSMGWAWSFTFIGLMMIVAVPLVVLVYVRGPGWRKERDALSMQSD